MNTRIGYTYTDRTDCRQYTSVVVEGTITWEHIQPYLAKSRSFIPGQVGLEDLQYRFALPGVDHPWHQISPEDIRPTEAQPTIALTGAELAERFAHAAWETNWRRAPDAPKSNLVDRMMSGDTTDEKTLRMRPVRPRL